MDKFIGNTVALWSLTLVALTLAGYIFTAKDGMKALKGFFSYFQMWFNLPKTIQRIDAKLLEKPMSPGARFCENCDGRMKTTGRTGVEKWEWHCQSCNWRGWYDRTK